MDVPYGLPLDFTSCITREYDGGGRYTQWTTVLEEWENWPTRIHNELDWSDVVTDPHMQTMDYGFVIGTVHGIANCQEIQRIYHQCSKHSYCHSRKDRLERMFISPSDLSPIIP